MKYLFANHRFFVATPLLWEFITSWVVANRKYNAFNPLDFSDVANNRKSNRLFIFGSGASINSIADAEWSMISNCGTLGFSASIYMRKVELDYLLLRAWVESSQGTIHWENDAQHVIDTISSNPFLRNTKFALQKGFTAIFTNRLIAHEMWPKEKKFFLFGSDKFSRYPHQSIRDGVVHRNGSLCSAISIGVLLGYRQIILAGVDLYDNRYFFLPPDMTLGWSSEKKQLVPMAVTHRGDGVASCHNTVNSGIVSIMADWRAYLSSAFGVELFVYNPKSLLAQVLPVFRFDEENLA